MQAAEILANDTELEARTRQITDSELVTRTLFVGNPVELQKDGEKRRYLGNIGGWVFETKLLLFFPDDDAVIYKLAKGDPVLVRYLERGNIYGTKLGTIHVYAGDQLLVTSWPRSLEVLRLSQDRRIKISYPLTFHLLCSDQKVRGFQAGLTDLSARGCRVEIAKGRLYKFKLQSGQQVVLSMRMPRSTEQVHLRAEVRNTQEMARMVSLGMYFSEGQAGKINQLAEAMGLELSL